MKTPIHQNLRRIYDGGNDGGHDGDLRADTQCQDHGEEEDRPQGSHGHRGDGLGGGRGEKEEKV